MIETKQTLIRTFQHLDEWNSLLSHLPQTLGSFIEIGTCHGGTFESLSRITTGKKISLDLSNGSFGGIGNQAAILRNQRIASQYKDTHFIDGDSKTIASVTKLASILNGEQVDFMFIDGDHTFKGVLSDFMIYRQFVKQDGFIAFHDIIDSDFHRNAGCFVHDFWSKLKGLEFVSPDNSDVTDNASGIGTHRFGGIGLIKNDFKESNFHIFQVIHDQESINLCIDTYIKENQTYIPTLMLNTENIYFENTIIKKVYETYKFKRTDYIGVTSPLVVKKSMFTIDKLISLCKSDVLNYGSVKCIAGNNLDVWQANGNGKKGTNLHKAAVELNESKTLDFDIFKNKWTCIYCNYFIVKVSIFESYVSSVLIPVMEWLQTSKWTKWNDPSVGLFHRNKWYPISVFVCECMFGTFLSRKKHNITDLRDSK